MDDNRDIHPLEEWLFRAGIAKKDFCESHGFAYSTIVAICHERRRPSWKMAKKIERATGKAVSAETLLMWKLK